MTKPTMKLRPMLSTALCGLSVLLSGCIRPQNYHVGAASAQAIQFPDQTLGKKHPVTYFKKALAYEAYIEFDAGGQLFETSQVDRALALVQNLKHPKGSAQEQPVAMLLFVHGWKNNASEQSGNVWGFRRILDFQADESAARGIPTVGIYIGWPGDATQIGKLFSFWSRESVASAVGGGNLDEVLEKLLIAVKGADYRNAAEGDSSQAILLGYSFGAQVLERAMIRIIRKQLDKFAGKTDIPSPADLIILLNEAGPARLARPLLLELLKDNLHYTDSGGTEFPLLVAMTSDGDAATKLAYPGGEFISNNRPATVNYQPPDAFGEKDSLPYNLLSPANMVALRNYQIVPGTGSGCYLVSTIHRQPYCVQKLPPPVGNTTPYWVMGLPQIFVPDHSSVFRPEMLQLADDFIRKQMGSAGIAGMNAVAAPRTISPQPRLMLRKPTP